LSNEPRYPSAPLENQQAQLVQQPDNGTGLWAMILGILGLLVFGPLTGVPAIFLGISGRRKAATGKATNGGQALAGIILGVAATVLTVLAVALILMLRMMAGVSTDL
jgi:Domain of unknown function (DUF4190)